MIKPHSLASSETQWIKGDQPVKEHEMNGLWVAQVLPVWRFFGAHNNNAELPHNKQKLNILTHLQCF